MDDRYDRHHSLGPIWMDLSAVVALLIAIAAFASWIAAFAALL
jgi:hypothetical protein